MADQSVVKDKYKRTGIITSRLTRDGNIFTIKFVSKDIRYERVKVVNKSSLPAPNIGEICAITGILVNDIKYGYQVIADSIKPELPNGNIIIQLLANNNKFQGIGYTKAQKLWLTFGNDIYDVLNSNDLNSLTSKDKAGLSHDTATLLLESWSEYQDEIAVVKFLQDNNIPTSLARKIREFWSTDTIAEINKDPYKMLAFCNWSTVDEIALTKFSVLTNSPLRLAAACEAAVYTEYDNKNTAITHSKLHNRLTNLIGSSNSDKAISIALDQNRIIQSHDNLYQGYGAHVLEHIIESRVQSLNSDETIQEQLFKPVYNPEAIKEYESTHDISLHKNQTKAIENTLTNPFSLILGGAGVGKTTVLKVIYHLINNKIPIIQVALSGRASVRMKEATNHESMTIARYLTLAREGRLPDYYFLFLDEASMLDAPTFYRILKYLPHGCRLCLVGDHYQLPPIGPGLVFHVFAASQSIPKVELTKVHRSATATGIPQITQAIRKQQLPTLESYKHITERKYGVSFKEEDVILSETLGYEFYKTISSLYWDCLEAGSTQVVAGTIKTSDAINIHLHNDNIKLRQYSNNPSPLVQNASQAITVDDMIIFTERNDYSRELYNGSIGKITKVFQEPMIEIDTNNNETAYVAEADFDTSGKTLLTADDFECIKLGYCITLHKAQGSQWDRCIVISEPTRAKGFIDNTWFYTAITRASKQVFVIGNYSTYKKAVTNAPTAFTRVTSLSVA